MSETLKNPKNEKPTIEEKTFRFEKYKFKAELFKWFIGSVALVIMTVIIDKGFRERAAGIQEMQAYDKYVEVILKADNIEERWKLSEYFATVTPTERLRERWEAYKDSIEIDYLKFISLNEEEQNLENKKNALLSNELVFDDSKSFEKTNGLSIKDSLILLEVSLSEVKNKKAPFEKKLLNTSDFGNAQIWEERGFAYLFNKDIEKAIEAFQNSENAYNQFHQVYEIAKYLKENKPKLISNDSEFWKTTYQKIATEYSWKMPMEIKMKLLENSK